MSKNRSIKWSQKHRPARSRHWTLREKRKFVSVLTNHGDTDLSKFTDAIPSKSKNQIVTFLKTNKQQAKLRLKKRDHGSQNNAVKIHQWLPLINSLNNGTEEVIHKNLSALMLLLISKYSQHPEARKFEGVDFRMAYMFLCNSLTNAPFPNSVNDATMAALLACTSQLMEEVRSEKTNQLFKNIMLKKKSEGRSEQCGSKTNSNYYKIFTLPEFNAFRWIKKEDETLFNSKTKA